MKRGLVLASLVILVAGLVLDLDRSASGQDETKVTGKRLDKLKLQFAPYGYDPKKTMVRTANNLHIKLPGGVPKVTQTGVSVHFQRPGEIQLAGECEASCTYDLIDFPAVTTGYGSSIGLVLDGTKVDSWGGIQRAFHPTLGSCFLLMTRLPDSGGKMKEEIKIVPTNVTKGRIGLRRVNDELILLAADNQTAELAEIHRTPFARQSIRAVRFFADPGGSPTALEVRLGEMSMRGEEAAGGTPNTRRDGFVWHWPLIALIAAGLALVSMLVWRRFKKVG